MSDEQTIISPPSDPLTGERTQALTPSGHQVIRSSAEGMDVTQAAIVIQCPVCQTTNPPGDQWCQDCGFLLTSAPPEAMELPAPAGPRLVWDGRELELRSGVNSIGRSAADVLLLDSTVSRHHATLTLEGESAWIEDVGSTNGTSVNGVPLPAGERRQIYDGDTLKLGSVMLKLLWPEGASAPPGALGGADVAERAPGEAAVARLLAEDGREHDLRSGVTTLGRRAENMVVLSGDAYISGRHAEIRCDDGGCVLVDVGSTNGTFLRRGASGDDWERLRPHDPQPITDGDGVRLGQTAFIFQAAPIRTEAAASDESPDEGETVGQEILPTEPGSREAGGEQSDDGG
jgi:pSer/pThr/pTyr-binding forkhead associated (FHA) protein